MMHERMTTNELFSALEALKDEANRDLIKELQMHQLELEIQNRESREGGSLYLHPRKFVTRAKRNRSGNLFLQLQFG